MRYRWIGVALMILLMATGCSEQTAAPEEPEGPKLTPGEKAAIQFYMAYEVEGDKEKVKEMTGEDLMAAKEDPKGPISIQNAKGEWITDTKGGYYIQKANKDVIKVVVEKDKKTGKWMVIDWEDVNTYAITIPEDEWKRVENP